jgi:transcriptional regulator with XRE-family HTH domain
MGKKYIGNRFANIRLAHNMSARKLSEELGQGSQYINQIENARKMPSIEGLFNFCDYFNITLKEFFDDEQTYPIQYKALLNELNKLDVDKLEHIIKNIKLIAGNIK